MRLKQLVLLLSLLVLAHCSDKPSRPPVGIFELVVQDSPADYEAAYIKFDSVAVRLVTDPDNWHTVYNKAQSLDIASFRNGRLYKLLEWNSQNTTIEALRIKFGVGRVVIDGSNYILNFPDSAARSRVLITTVPIELGRTSSTLLDINLANSIYRSTENGLYYFDPEVLFLAVDSTGYIDGYINRRANGYLLPENGEEIKSFTICDTSSNYFGFYGLPQGIYDVVLKPRGEDTLRYDSLYISPLPVYPGTGWHLENLELPGR